MSSVKSRFRMARDLEEAAKLIYSKNPKTLRNFRAKKPLWEDGVYENADRSETRERRLRNTSPLEVDLVQPRSTKAVTLPTVNWLKRGEP